MTIASVVIKEPDEETNDGRCCEGEKQSEVVVVG